MHHDPWIPDRVKIEPARFWYWAIAEREALGGHVRNDGLYLQPIPHPAPTRPKHTKPTHKSIRPHRVQAHTPFMRIVAQPRFDPAPLEAFGASMRAWLIQLLAWFCATIECLPPTLARRPEVRAALAMAKHHVRADLRESVRDLRKLLIAHAFIRLALPARRTRTQRPSSIRPGFRRAARRSTLVRRFVGNALAGIHDGGLRQRTERLGALLGNLEPLIARVHARMQEMLRKPIGVGLVLNTAYDALRSPARTPVTARTDTS